jgi:hypothetical protein
LLSSALKKSDGSAIPPSDILNKKLACCMNYVPQTVNNSAGIPLPTPSYKFDCVETQDPPAAVTGSQGISLEMARFNWRWTSHDATEDGKKINGVMLVNAAGKPITGFFSLKGEYCEKFNPFMNKFEIRPTLVPAALPAGQQANATLATETNLAAPYPMPQGDNPIEIAAYAKGRSFPTTIDEKRACPILVRAAMRVKCPLGGSLRYVDFTGVTHCPFASSIRFDIAVEQIYQIAGQKARKPYLTEIGQGSVNTISIPEIIRERLP